MVIDQNNENHPPIKYREGKVLCWIKHFSNLAVNFMNKQQLYWIIWPVICNICLMKTYMGSGHIYEQVKNENCEADLYIQLWDQIEYTRNQYTAKRHNSLGHVQDLFSDLLSLVMNINLLCCKSGYQVLGVSVSLLWHVGIWLRPNIEWLQRWLCRM